MSYMLKAIFEKVKKVKFILVIPANAVEEFNSDSFAKSFIGFFRMFHYLELSADIRKQIMDSTSIILSRSNSSEEYLNIIEGAV